MVVSFGIFVFFGFESLVICGLCRHSSCDLCIGLSLSFVLFCVVTCQMTGLF